MGICKTSPPASSPEKRRGEIVRDFEFCFLRIFFGLYPPPDYEIYHDQGESEWIIGGKIYYLKFTSLRPGTKTHHIYGYERFIHKKSSTLIVEIKMLPE